MLDRLEVSAGTVEEDFRLAVRQLAAGISIVTAGDDKERGGFTATSVISLSVDPPRLLVSVDNRSKTWPLLQSNKGFSVNLLAHDQAHLAEVFAGRTQAHGSDRFAGAAWRRYPGAGFALEGAIASVHCVLEEAIERHGHVLVIGRVLASTTAPAPALIHWDRSFHKLGS